MKTPEERASEILGKHLYLDGHDEEIERDIAQAIREAQAEAVAAASRWIPVAERLPEHGERILLLSSRYAYIGRYDADVHLWYPDDAQGSSDIVTGVTHWMPLPGLPDQC